MINLSDLTITVEKYGTKCKVVITHAPTKTEVEANNFANGTPLSDKVLREEAMIKLQKVLLPVPLKCFVCNKEIESVGDFSSLNQPYGATTFTSYGHYGSTAFDSFCGESLEINVCDPCLLERKYKVLYCASRTNDPECYEIWNGK